jgi:hypothetical protein
MCRILGQALDYIEKMHICLKLKVLSVYCEGREGGGHGSPPPFRTPAREGQRAWGGVMEDAITKLKNMRSRVAGHSLAGSLSSPAGKTDRNDGPEGECCTKNEILCLTDMRGHARESLAMAAGRSRW